MKKLLAVLVLVLFGTMTYAQWNTSGTAIYNTNTGNVLVGDGASWTSVAKFNMRTAGTASMWLESTAPAGTTAAITYGQFRLKATVSGHIFNNSLRYFQTAGDPAWHYEMLQSLYDPIAAKFCEFLYFRFTDHKFEFRDGITDGEFKNIGKIYFNNAGGVGIGMGTYAMPSGAKFAVNGKAVVKEIEVTLTGMPPDYVFDNNYKLRSLYDVENFINTNKHLPDVPSATQMTNGVNLGDMSATLLQKVEELTLYMIQLQKENDALKARISNLEK